MTVIVSRRCELVLDEQMLARALRDCAERCGVPLDLLDAGSYLITAVNELARDPLAPRRVTTLDGVTALRIVYRREYEEP